MTGPSAGAPGGEALHRVVYRSEMALVGTAAEVGDEIRAILAASRRNNAAAALTGALLYSGRHFTQVLEGPLDALERTYDRISADLRHSAFDLVQFVPLQARTFGEWGMAYVTPGELDGIWDDRPAFEPSAPLDVEALVAALRRALAAGERGVKVDLPRGRS
ncbi:MAG: BLUF domain-containing protein [Acetobacteraceae bacterium]|nr:BLUF domain-containing protein [Acetobacteraceae bacterium]